MASLGINGITMGIKAKDLLHIVLSNRVAYLQDAVPVGLKIVQAGCFI